MDEEKKGIDLPENEKASEEAPEANGDVQAAENVEPSSDESAGPDAAGGEQMPQAEEADSAEQSEAPAEDIPAEGAPAPEGDDPSESESPLEDGKENLLSQDDIDSVLGDMADQLEGDEESEADIDSMAGDVKQADFQQLSQASADEKPRNIELLMDVELPVSIELGRTRLNISDILALGPGSIVELDKLVGEPVDLLVNQKCVARGEVVVVEESFGLRITQLVSPEERLKNLQ